MTVPLPDRIAAANADALRRIGAAVPVLARVREARDVIAGMDDRTLLHAGPPIAAEGLCGPMRGAILGAVCYEGWAQDVNAAGRLLAAGGITLRCTHDAGAVGPMAGVISPSMPLMEVRNAEHGTTAYAPFNEGVGGVLRFGAYDAPVLARLRWMREVLAPAVDAGLQRLGGLQLVPLMARALTMGDEMHQRNVAATSLFFRALAPALVETAASPSACVGVLRFLADTDQFFLNVAMAAAKAVLESVREISYCTVVTAMSRNGVEFGIRVSGLGDRWFTAPAPAPVGMYFSGFGPQDANPDMGDSAILETFGLGGLSMAAAPAVVGFVGIPSMDEALATTRAMGEITLGQSAHFKIPTLDFAGAPTGVDLRAVVKVGVTPVINTGIAHHQAGKGQIGAGVVRAPLAAFQSALAAFADRYAGSGDATAATGGARRGMGGLPET